MARLEHALADSRFDRRDFLKVSSAAAASAFVSGLTPARAQSRDKLRLAVIGCGGRGADNLESVSSEEIVALCDVNRRTLEKAAVQFPKARTEVDYRRLYDRAADFDAVVVSTAEHTHAFATLPALQLKKHVYCEKPLTYNVQEARIIRETAARAGVATQMGTQIHASDNYRRVVELVQGNTVGPIRECHVWVSRAWGLQSEAEAKQNKDIVFVQDRPASADPIPAGREWDLWLGPAPARPYNDVYLPGPKWYRWWDFGNGTMSDLGSHDNDVPYTVLNLARPDGNGGSVVAPLTIEAVSPNVPIAHKELAPATMRVTYEYAAVGAQPALTMVWHQGDSKPPGWVSEWGRRSCVFIGGKGMLLGNGKLLPEERFKDFEKPPETLPRSPGHWVEWVNHAKGNGPVPGSNFQYSAWTTEANHLGNVAYRAGKKLEWDYKNMRAINAPEANPFIKRVYRKGWQDILSS